MIIPGSVRDLIESAAAGFPLVTIYLERDDPDICFIGRPLRWSKKHVVWRDISLDADDRRCPAAGGWTRSRVDVGGQYETALARVLQADAF